MSDIPRPGLRPRGPARGRPRARAPARGPPLGGGGGRRRPPRRDAHDPGHRRPRRDAVGPHRAAAGHRRAGPALLHQLRQRQGAGPGRRRPPVPSSSTGPCSSARSGSPASPSASPATSRPPTSPAAPVGASWPPGPPSRAPCCPTGAPSRPGWPRSRPASTAPTCPCPRTGAATWSGPTAVELWQGRPSRLHDRLRYRATTSGWVLERLSP